MAAAAAGFRRRRRRHRRGHRWRHGRRFHRFGPRRLRLRGFRLRRLPGIWSGVWRHLAGHFVAGHHGLTGTICGHPEMIPSRALRPPRGGRPVSTSCALTCACPTSRTQAIYSRRRNGTLARPLPDRSSNRVMDVRQPACWCYPPECANGYEWGPERVIVSWSPRARLTPRPCSRIRRPITTTAACTSGRVRLASSRRALSVAMARGSVRG